MEREETFYAPFTPSKSYVQLNQFKLDENQQYTNWKTNFTKGSRSHHLILSLG